MDLTLAEQRKDLEKACDFLNSKLKELEFQKNVLTNAFNSIDKNNENILESGSILAQQAREIMSKINYKNI